MEKAYEILIKEHKLTLAELPEDAKTGIRSIKDVEHAVVLAEKKSAKAGKVYTMSSALTSKIKALDKWVVREILDYVEDKDTNTDEPIVSATEIIEEIKKDDPIKKEAEPVVKKEEVPAAPESTEADPKGLEIDKEFNQMISNNQVEVTLDQLKELANTAYYVIFDNYDKDGQNGISTTNFDLIEKNDKFILTKK